MAENQGNGENGGDDQAQRPDVQPEQVDKPMEGAPETPSPDERIVNLEAQVTEMRETLRVKDEVIDAQGSELVKLRQEAIGYRDDIAELRTKLEEGQARLAELEAAQADESKEDDTSAAEAGSGAGGGVRPPADRSTGDRGDGRGGDGNGNGRNGDRYRPSAWRRASHGVKTAVIGTGAVLLAAAAFITGYASSKNSASSGTQAAHKAGGNSKGLKTAGDSKKHETAGGVVGAIGDAASGAVANAKAPENGHDGALKVNGDESHMVKKFTGDSKPEVQDKIKKLDDKEVRSMRIGHDEQRFNDGLDRLHSLDRGQAMAAFYLGAEAAPGDAAAYLNAAQGKAVDAHRSDTLDQQKDAIKKLATNPQTKFSLVEVSPGDYVNWMMDANGKPSAEIDHLENLQLLRMTTPDGHVVLLKIQAKLDKQHFCINIVQKLNKRQARAIQQGVTSSTSSIPSSSSLSSSQFSSVANQVERSSSSSSSSSSSPSSSTTPTTPETTGVHPPLGDGGPDEANMPAQDTDINRNPIEGGTQAPPPGNATADGGAGSVRPGVEGSGGTDAPAPSPSDSGAAPEHSGGDNASPAPAPDTSTAPTR